MSRIVYCHCSFARVLPPDVKNRVLEGLAASGRAFDAAPDGSLTSPAIEQASVRQAYRRTSERQADGMLKSRKVWTELRSGRSQEAHLFDHLPRRRPMYTKPQVVKFGTLRELTQIGWDCDTDGVSVIGITGDNIIPGCTRTS